MTVGPNPLFPSRAAPFSHPTRTQSIYLADMCGATASPIGCASCNGEVCYGPNLGYGRFGAQVTLDCKL